MRSAARVTAGERALARGPVRLLLRPLFWAALWMAALAGSLQAAPPVSEVTGLTVMFAGDPGKAGRNDSGKPVSVDAGKPGQAHEQGDPPQGGGANTPGQGLALAAHPGLRFGLVVVPQGSPQGSPVVLEVRLSRPGDPEGAPSLRWLVPARMGFPAWCLWEFAYEWEIQPGVWTMEVLAGETSSGPVPFTLTPGPTPGQTPGQTGDQSSGQSGETVSPPTPGTPQTPAARTAQTQAEGKGQVPAAGKALSPLPGSPILDRPGPAASNRPASNIASTPAKDMSALGRPSPSAAPAPKEPRQTSQPRGPGGVGSTGPAAKSVPSRGAASQGAAAGVGSPKSPVSQAAPAVSAASQGAAAKNVASEDAIKRAASQGAAATGAASRDTAFRGATSQGARSQGPAADGAGSPAVARAGGARVYVLMGGSFSDEARAMWMAALLKGQGIKACVREAHGRDGRLSWGVVLGWKNSPEEARLAKENLLRTAKEVLVVPMSAAELEKGLTCRDGLSAR